VTPARRGTGTTESAPATAGTKRKHNAEATQVSVGVAQPLGATPTPTGVNFSIYSEHATCVTLLLFDSPDGTTPVEIVLDAGLNKSFHFWHCHVAGIGPGQVYAYRMDGPFDPSGTGLRFNHNKVLIDPYALGNINTVWDRNNAVGPKDNVATSMRSVVIDPTTYDWEGDRPLNIPLSETIIYELHVRGFTKSPSSGVEHQGTFTGIIEKIPYLKSLGITAVELLPIFDFDETQILRVGPTGQLLTNYWGYDPYGHWAPQSSYCASPHLGTHLDEFRDMVKALHRAGIEVILDVVFNHTSEGNQNGPTISFRGQANEAYYMLSSADPQYYMDFSGCGNTFNANHPVITKYIVECLEYWVTEHHVDGFRFDLGSVLSRGPDGAEMPMPPVLWNIELSRVLWDTKLIAEAWDAGGLYQVGRFPGKRWSQWNGPYRDCVRKFVKSEPGLIAALATRIAGSSDLFGPSDEMPTNSINFVSCHDGFTLNDLVSYNEKHNDGNGEGNRDGSDDNNSWNCRFEGLTEDPEVERLRERQTRNFAAILMLSRGVPMFVAGDEFRRTQLGNNNAYCQDNELSWVDWTLAEKHADLIRFWCKMIGIRNRFTALRRPSFFSNEVNERGLIEITWHGRKLRQPGWRDPYSRALCFTLAGFDGEDDLHVILNMLWEAVDFELPSIPGRRWVRAVDTWLLSPEEILDPGDEVPVKSNTYHAGDRSVVVLISQKVQS
jgi:isoamylase